MNWLRREEIWQIVFWNCCFPRLFNTVSDGCAVLKPFGFIYLLVELKLEQSFDSNMDDNTIPALVEKLCRSLSHGKPSESSIIRTHTYVG